MVGTQMKFEYKEDMAVVQQAKQGINGHGDKAFLQGVWVEGSRAAARNYMPTNNTTIP